MSIIALGVVASTINSVVGIEAAGGPDFDIDRSAGGVDPNVSSINESKEPAGNISSNQNTIDMVVCIDFLTTFPAIFGVVTGVITILYGIYRRFNAATAVLSGTALIPFVWALYFFTTNCISSSGGSSGGMLSGSSMVSNEGGLNSPPLPPEAVAGIFAIVTIIGVAVMFTMVREDETFEPIEEEPEAPDTAAFAAAAGRAATRIEEANVPVDNSVYRAWVEMTALLDIENPDATAPRDFAKEAVDTGLERDDVDELTELFNEVRYGEKRADTREERAIEILRNIEETYKNTSSNVGSDK